MGMEKCKCGWPLEGEVVEVSPGEKNILLEKKEELEKLGFGIESFGGDSFAVKTIPLVFGKVRVKELLQDILARWKIKTAWRKKRRDHNPDGMPGHAVMETRLLFRRWKK